MKNSVLYIGGHDPSAGAGILADCKTVHNFGLNGFGVATALTYQTENKFLGLDWVPVKKIEAQLQPLAEQPYPIGAIKIGLVESLNVLTILLKEIKKYWPQAPLVWDPVLRASAGYSFHCTLDNTLLQSVLNRVDVVTPNSQEAAIIAEALAIKSLFDWGGETYLILKGGHESGEAAIDKIVKRGIVKAEVSHPRLVGKAIHGSGCIYSSAIASGLAKGWQVEKAASEAKEYVYKLLSISETGLAPHHLANA